MVEHQAPLIAFVWRPEEIIPPVIHMAHRTGCRAIFDVSTLGVEALRPVLRQADPAGQVRDIKISASTLMDPSLGPWLQETGVQNIWVECHPQSFPSDPSAVLERLRELSENHRCFPIIGDLPLLAAVVKDSSKIGRIVLKGCEASGFVSAETTLALYAAVKEMRQTASNPLDILIWGGVATPEAAAALLATGAAGIIFESVHWLTDLVAIDNEQRQRLLNLRLDSTDLVGLDLGVPCRLFNKGNSLAFKEIKAFENSLCGAGITEAGRRAFASRVEAGAVHPLASRFSPDEVIPLGVEATFAASFVERFGAGTAVAWTSGPRARAQQPSCSSGQATFSTQFHEFGCHAPLSCRISGSVGVAPRRLRAELPHLARPPDEPGQPPARLTWPGLAPTIDGLWPAPPAPP